MDIRSSGNVDKYQGIPPVYTDTAERTTIFTELAAKKANVLTSALRIICLFDALFE
ncbi:hypothetical protein [Lentibacillus juripiscarius]|uniref:hypothetical protein n=1 Tax=Lentibacillus juripiscarius TaxID=257446 RepID=UPI0036D2A417